MVEVEEHVLTRIVALCTETDIAGSHNCEGVLLFLVLASELHNLDRGDSLRFLLGVVERHNPSNEFRPS